MTDFDNLTYLHGKPQGNGVLKASPEDFLVVEDLSLIHISEPTRPY